ncbi:hypothetical protein NEUTE2DRAFT_72792, partial [Neurospora tetrasperma FGSC 2509]
YINNILYNILNIYTITYFNNILIYFKNKAEYITYVNKKVRIVFERFRDAGLYLNPNKYKFAVKKVKYFSFIIYASIGI